MNIQLQWFAAINVIGGLSVLGSYAWGILSHPENRNDLWGDISGNMYFMYVAFMFIAAGSYLWFTWYLFAIIDAESITVFGKYGFNVFNISYLGILIFSTIWMPLSLHALDTNNSGLEIWIRAVLGLTALFSLLLLAALMSLEPTGTSTQHNLAVVCAALFCIQTVILDALIWPNHFSV